jgi:hypothetical protein
VNIRYKAGLVGYLDVLVAQTTLLSNQRTAEQISGQRMVATVVLVKALGGGWLGVSAASPSKPNTNQSGETAIPATRVRRAPNGTTTGDANQTLPLPE